MENQGQLFSLKKYTRHLKFGVAFVWAFTGTMLIASSVVQASDLQIYAVPTAGKKTIVMMLDTSGSMNANSNDYRENRILALKNGMNAFEGLYHLYLGYGQTYSDGKDYISAARMFEINVSLADNFGLTNKYEQALSDYGYHLVLDHHKKPTTL